MRKAGKLAAEVLDMITDHVAVGISTEELDRICHEYIVEKGAVPAPLNYKGFPKSHMHLVKPCALPRHPF